MPTPTDELRDEHRIIERVLTVLETSAARLHAGEAVSPETLARAREIIIGFGDSCHHAKEERALFPVIAAKRAIIRRGPVQILTSEHAAGRTLMADLARGIEEMSNGDAHGGATALKAITSYTRMLRRHIEKEEDILFPLADSLLTDAETASMREQFEAVERDIGPAHERYVAEVAALEATLV